MVRGGAVALEEMVLALDAARKYYAEWFHPFPWSVLKLSEYPGYVGGGQGFPTNIVVSELEGFVDRSAPGERGPFAIVAHEAAHNCSMSRTCIPHRSGLRGRLRQGPLGDVDAAAGDGPGRHPGGAAGVHRGVQDGPGLSGDQACWPC